MKFWIVVTIFGKVAMSVGPLPDSNEGICNALAKVKETEISAKFKGGLVLPHVDGDPRDVNEVDVRVKCVASDTRPTP